MAATAGTRAAHNGPHRGASTKRSLAPKTRHLFCIRPKGAIFLSSSWQITGALFTWTPADGALSQLGSLVMFLWHVLQPPTGPGQHLHDIRLLVPVRWPKLRLSLITRPLFGDTYIQRYAILNNYVAFIRVTPIFFLQIS